MPGLKRFQLGLIHVAVAMTLVPINSTLNRVMIKELALSATVVAVLASLPFLLAPMQMAVGSFSDRHPLFGMRRTPYILAGLVLCAAGVTLAPQAALLMGENFEAGIVAGLAAFGAWGLGYNLSSVSYLSLASELSGETGRGKTIATMWFMMIVGIIATAIALSQMVDPYTPAAMVRAFAYIAAAALAVGCAGLLRLEPRSPGRGPSGEVYSLGATARAISRNPVARRYFIYLLLLLAAILGQDVLLEPFGAEAFGLTVTQTTRITSLWGACVLASIVLAGALEGRTGRRSVAQAGNTGALAGLVVIVASGIAGSLPLFYAGVVALGVGTGLSTVANLAIMFELTVPGQVGLYMGAWGFSSALSRLTGSILGGAMRDLVTQATGQSLSGYLVVFSLEAALLLTAIILFMRLDVRAFASRSAPPGLAERAALASEL